MKLRNFLDRLSYYSLDEFEQLIEFSNFYFKGNKELIPQKALIQLKKYFPKFSETYNEIDFFNSLYDKEPFNILKLNKTFTILSKLLDQYTIYNFATQDISSASISLLKKAITQQNNKYFEDEFATIKDELNKTTIKSDLVYRTILDITELNYQFEITQDFRKGDLNLQEVADSLDTYWTIKKLETYSAMLSRKNMFNVEFDNLLINELIEQLPNTKFIQVPIIQVLYTNIQLNLNPTEQNYNLLFNSLLANKKLLNKDDLRGHYSTLENNIPKIFKQESVFEKVFELYKIQIEQDLIIQNGYISSTLYSNIITIGIRLNNYTWTKNFIEDYQKHLPENFAKDYYNYNKARLLFAQGKYDKTLEWLTDLDYKNAEIKLGAKRLLAKSYFELKEYNSLEHVLKALKIFIYRNTELSKNNLDMNDQFMKVFSKLLKIAQDPNKKGLQKLNTELQNTAQLIDKAWFLQKTKTLL